MEKQVFLNTNSGHISFGHGGATSGVGGAAFPGDGVSYAGNVLAFNPTGFGNAGYVYLENDNNRTYAIGTLSSGIIMLKKWNGAAWEDQ